MTQKPRRKTIKDMKSIAFDHTQWRDQVKQDARALVEALVFDWDSEPSKANAIRELSDNLMLSCGHKDLLSTSYLQAQYEELDKQLKGRSID